MPDTVRTLAALQTLLADNTDGDISAQDVRDMLLSLSSPGFNAVATAHADDVMWHGDLAGLTEQTVSGSVTWTEARGILSAKGSGMTAQDSSSQLKAVDFSIGDAWVVPVFGMMMIAGSDSGDLKNAGICFTDGTDATSNVVMGHIQIDPTGVRIFVGRHGTLTNINVGAPWVGDLAHVYHVQVGVYIKLIYQASNSFRLEFSPDGVSFSAFGEADIAKTMTPTHVGVIISAVDNFDGLMTFGPLMKVA